jgi:hypothetical protein
MSVFAPNASKATDVGGQMILVFCHIDLLDAVFQGVVMRTSGEHSFYQRTKTFLESVAGCTAVGAEIDA